jgi:prepilin-type N-terminal cleavage/methylation domain-containing protein
MSSPPHNRRRRGYTLVEMMVGSAVMLLVLGGAFSLMINMLRMQQRLQIKSVLDENLEKSVEYIRRDMRLSSTGVGLLAWYPSDAVEYTAVSMPIGGDENNDGLLDRNPDGSIKWYSTVIYHVAPGNPDKLRRTRFTPRKNGVHPDNYYEQLKGVVEATDPNAYANYEMSGESVTSTIIFENLVKMSFRPPEAQFDGYAPTPGTKRFNFGAVLLGAGNRYLQLHTESKNPDSSGYRIKVDSMSVGASGTPREAELYAPTYRHPDYPHYYMSFSQGNVTGLRGSEWSGDAALLYIPTRTPATASFHLYNDIRCDTSFSDPPAAISSNCSVKIDQSYASSYPYVFDRVVSMDKGVAWTASSGATMTTSLVYAANMSVSVPLYGADALKPHTIVRNGRWARLSFQRTTTNNLRIRNVYLHDVSSGTSEQVTFDGGSSGLDLLTTDPLVGTSDWVEEWEIDRSKTYEVTFDIAGAIGNPSGAHTWHNGGITNISTINGVPYPGIPALASLETGYPDEAIYRSEPFDTQTDDPRYRYLSWTHDEYFSDGGDIDMRIRAGDKPDMSDASWTDAYASYDGYFQSNNRNNIASMARGRYVQYEAILTCGRGGSIPEAHVDVTPILRDVTIEWTPPRTLTDVIVEFGTGPDCGIVRATVDGIKLVRALEVEMEIYRDSVTKRETATGRFEIRPLNSGL